jgi:hypothetical protein
MTNTDRKVVITVLAAAALVAAGCAGPPRTNGQEAGVPAPPDGAIEPDRPIADSRDLAAPIEAPAARADEPMACALKRPIASAACTRCLAARCCEEASGCEMVTGTPLLGGGRVGCEGALFCAKQCPDAGGGACRIDVSNLLTAERCSQGPLGPQGVATLVRVVQCAAKHCADECAQGP